jgi:HK97 family phage major capsid protein
METNEKEVQSAIGELTQGVKKLGDQASKLLEEQKQISEALSRFQEEQQELRALADSAMKGSLRTPATRELRPGQVVTDDCAEYLAAIMICGAERLGKLGDTTGHNKTRLLEKTGAILGLNQKAALTTSDIALPVVYSAQVVELVWKYGQARKYGTVYPMGAGTAKLPRLKTSPAFGFIAMSAAIGEKSPQFEHVQFDAQKAGGIIRVPSEIDADSIVQLGQFLARYISRETARWEDKTFFAADGTGTYNSLKGIGKAAVDLGHKIVLGSGKTHPSDITMADLRNLRAQINTAALPYASYMLNMTMEALLVSFNTAGNVYYIPNGANGPTLDGFPVRWVDVLPVYDQSAHVSQIQALFGDPSYMYLGTRGQMRVETSADVYFATDEIAMRALERFTIGLMADDSNAALQLAAS